MGLFGPDDATMLLAEDDDSGRGYNARIAALLQPGTYVLRVRHYKPTGTGVYRISIKSQRAA
jgi:tyrosinase